MTKSLPPAAPIELLQASHAPKAPPPKSAPSDPEQIKADLLAQMREQRAVKRFQRMRPDLWLAIQRVARVLGLQRQVAGEEFPPGSCFVHTSMPDQQVFCLKRVLEISVDTATATFEIHEDNELTEGIVIVPVETVTWVGFPAHSVPLTFELRGLTGPEPVSPSVEAKPRQRRPSKESLGKAP